MKNILIFGLGVSGEGVLNFCKERGINFAVYDKEKSKCIGDTANLNNFDLVVLSPGIPRENKFLIKIKEAGLKVISDLELFKHFASPSVKIIGVTGSNGKSTTVSLIYHILKEAGKKVFLGGNIGKSPLVKEAFEAEFCVFEVSSFQLEITDFVFDASALLNISNNHAASHGGMENYKKAKERILKGEGFRIKPFDFSLTEILKQGYSMVKNKFYKNGELLVDISANPALKGEHNLKNILVAIAICFDFVKIDLKEAIKFAFEFKGLVHRLEFVREVKGVDFINDSKSTSVDATLSALKTFANYNIFLIAGGKMEDKNIVELFETKEFLKVREVLLIGESSGFIAKQIVKYNNSTNSFIKYSICGTLEKAVKNSYKSALKMQNSIVMLSPFCPSLDQFKNFEERGESFKKIVNLL